jgi:hypothetical protein
MMLMILFGVTVVCLFASMVLSAMASSDISQGDMEKGKKYCTISAVLSGVSLIIIFVVLGLTFYSKKGSIQW